MDNIVFVKDAFLDEFKTNFDANYKNFYTNFDKEAIAEVFNDNNIIESSIQFDFKELLLESENPNAVEENVQILYESLKHLTISEASNEKLWVALCNTYYLDYHLDQLKLIDNHSERFRGRTVFTHSQKRSLFLNNLSLLWWIAYYTYDEKSEDPYYYTKLFVRGSYRGNAVGFFSSNIHSHKEITIGILEAINELVETGKMIENRYSYTNANKILNLAGGVIVLDLLNRDEVKTMILENLLDTENIRVPK